MRLKPSILSLLLIGLSLFCTPVSGVETLSLEALHAHWLKQVPENQQGLIGAPLCGVQVHKFLYNTVGGEGEPTNASGALMIPEGSAPACHGPRPLVLYAHGTAIDRSEDLSAVHDPGNPAYHLAWRIALIFAAQGFIVVAPNYAGYDISTLPYAPYLNEKQQSRDLLDGLEAGRKLISKFQHRARDNGKLFVTGYSQGGYVALAALKALDAQGQPATAGAPLSGPYALAAAGDEVFLGHPNFGASVYLSMIANSYAHLAHGPLRLEEVFNPQYPDAPHLFPGNVSKKRFASLVQAGKIPLAAIFQSPPTGYDNIDALHESLFNTVWLDPTNYLIDSAFRSAYLQDVMAHPDGAAPPDGSTPDFSARLPNLPAHPDNLLRQHLKANDLRDYVPTMPLLLCGAHRDPEVFWNQGAGTFNALLDSKRANHPALRYVTLDLDTHDVGNTFSSHGLTAGQLRALKKTALAAQSAFVVYQYRNTLDNVISLLSLKGYHALEEPYCSVVARTFFALF